MRRSPRSIGSISTAVSGSGRNGRITRRNVLEFIHSQTTTPAAPPAAAPRAAAAASAAAAAPAARAPAPAAAPPAGAKTLPFTRIRKLTAEHMVRSKATSPHVLQAVEVDFHRVDVVRKTVRDAWKAKHGHSLTYLPFIANAVCRALEDFPNLNSSVHGDSLILHPSVNLAIAVDLGAEGPRRARHQGRGPAQRRANRRCDRRDRAALARRQAEARRLRRRHLHAVELGHVRHADHGADHQSAPGRNLVDRRRAQEDPSSSNLRKATRSRFDRSACSRNRSIIAPSTARTRPRSWIASARFSRRATGSSKSKVGRSWRSTRSDGSAPAGAWASRWRSDCSRRVTPSASTTARAARSSRSPSTVRRSSIA